jgi:hypothetical protein
MSVQHVFLLRYSACADATQMTEFAVSKSHLLSHKMLCLLVKVSNPLNVKSMVEKTVSSFSSPFFFAAWYFPCAVGTGGVKQVPFIASAVPMVLVLRGILHIDTNHHVIMHTHDYIGDDHHTQKV